MINDKEALQARRDNVRNDRNHSSYDPDYAAETPRLYRTRYGDTAPESSGASSPTLAALFAGRRDDPRNDRNSPNYDPAYAQQTLEMYKKFLGDAGRK